MPTIASESFKVVVLVVSSYACESSANGAWKRVDGAACTGGESDIGE